jgi:hypothetical protein
VKEDNGGDFPSQLGQNFEVYLFCPARQALALRQVLFARRLTSCPKQPGQLTSNLVSLHATPTLHPRFDSGVWRRVSGATVTCIFDFHSGFRINLHQFLIGQASAAETAPLGPPEWRDAVSYYRRVIVPQDLMSAVGQTVNNSPAKFHESSHSSDGKVSTAPEEERVTRGPAFQASSQPILFYTAGEIARRYLPNYKTFAFLNRIFVNGWPERLPVVERDWNPYLDDRTDLASAVRAVVADYGIPK